MRLHLLLSLGLALITAIAYHSLWAFEFVGDSEFLIAENIYYRDLSYFWEVFWRNYFWSDAGHMVPYWRPMTKISWLLEYQFFADFAGGYLMVSLSWFILLVLGVYALGNALGLPKLFAFGAASTVALHPIAIPPVSMVMARSDVVCAAAAVWVVYCFGRFLKDRHWLWGALTVFIVIIGLMSKEAFIVMAGVMSFQLLRACLQKRQVLPAATGVWLGVCSLCLIYYIVRLILLEKQAPGLSRSHYELNPLRIASSLALYGRNLWPGNPISNLRSIPITEAQNTWLWLEGLSYLLGLGFISAWLHKYGKASLLLLLWLGAGLLPVMVVEQILIPNNEGKFPLAERWALMALAPCHLLIWLLAAQHLRSQIWQRLLIGALGIWATVMLSMSTAQRAEYKDHLGFLANEDRLFHMTPSAYHSKDDKCRHQDRQAVRHMMQENWAQAAQILSQTIQNCSLNKERRLNIALSYLRSQNCSQALRYLAPLLTHTPRARYPSHSQAMQVCSQTAQAKDQNQQAQTYAIFAKLLITPQDTLKPEE